MTWYSEKGIPLPDSTIALVDTGILAQLYQEETDSGLHGPTNETWNKANLATRHAWNLGYLNPRIAGKDTAA